MHFTTLSSASISIERIFARVRERPRSSVENKKLWRDYPEFCSLEPQRCHKSSTGLKSEIVEEEFRFEQGEKIFRTATRMQECLLQP